MMIFWYFQNGTGIINVWWIFTPMSGRKKKLGYFAKYVKFEDEKLPITAIQGSSGGVVPNNNTASPVASREKQIAA